MKFSISWLKNHLEIKEDVSIDDIIRKLSSIGLEVESYSEHITILEEKKNSDQIDKKYENFKIVEIIDAQKHLNAERLNVCTVSDNNTMLQIVCGAQNARKGLKTVLAPIGQYISKGDFTIKKAKIRGVESNGMLCSLDELGLDGEGDGIIEMHQNAEVGASLASYLSNPDCCIEVSITPNRGDAASIRGIARDLYASSLGDLKELGAIKMLQNHGAIDVAIDPDVGCFEFMISHITNINNIQLNNDITTMQKQLAIVGLAIHSPLVTISNYTMLDLGRPNHIYDASKIVGKIYIRHSKKGEKFVAIGGMEYVLPDGILIVADDEKVLSIAGVMGGELSKVDDNTTEVFVEVAVFCPDVVAKSGRLLSILSDSRYRFERNVDRSLSLYTASFISNAIEKSLGGHLKAFYCQADDVSTKHSTIHLDIENIQQILGHNIDADYIIEILDKLGFKAIADNTILVPPHRIFDVSTNADLAEEVARIYGLDKILPQPFERAGAYKKDKDQLKIEHVRNLMMNKGFDELITYSFISPNLCDIFQLDQSIVIKNPISIDMSVMRHSMVPMLVESAIKNFRYGQDNGSIFEIGHNFYPNNKHMLSISGLRFGTVYFKHFLKEERSFDFFDIKSDVFSILALYGINADNISIERKAPSYYHPGKSASLMIKTDIIGYFGELHPSVLQKMDANLPIIGFEVFISNLQQHIMGSDNQDAVIISNLQKVDRDFAFLLDKKQDIGPIITDIRSISSEIENISVFDLYQGDKLPKDTKSVGLSVRFRPSINTLTEAQISDFSHSIVQIVLSKYGGIQR